MTDDRAEFLLRSALQVAVPLRIAEIAAMTPSMGALVLEEWPERAANALTSGGDILMHGGKKMRHETAGVFDHLAKGLACLAQQPGGVTFAGLHWCVAPHDPIPCPNQREATA